MAETRNQPRSTASALLGFARAKTTRVGGIPSECSGEEERRRCVACREVARVGTDVRVEQAEHQHVCCKELADKAYVEEWATKADNDESSEARRENGHVKRVIVLSCDKRSL